MAHDWYESCDVIKAIDGLLILDCRPCIDNDRNVVVPLVSFLFRAPTLAVGTWLDVWIIWRGRHLYLI